MTEQTTPQRTGTSRRDFLRRSAIVGGTLVWAAPAVQTLARPAFASHGTCAEVRLYEYTRSGSNWNPVSLTTTTQQPACVPVGGHWVAGQGTGAAADVTVARIGNDNNAVSVDVDAAGCIFLAASDLKAMHGTTSCIDGTLVSDTRMEATLTSIERIRFQLCCNPV